MLRREFFQALLIAPLALTTLEKPEPPKRFCDPDGTIKLYYHDDETNFNYYAFNMKNDAEYGNYSTMTYASETIFCGKIVFSGRNS